MDSAVARPPSGAGFFGFALLPLLLSVAGAAPCHAQDPAVAIAELPAATTTVDDRGDRFLIELQPIEVPPGRTILTPVYRVIIPFEVSLYGFAVEVLGDTGAPVPRDRLHHFVMTDLGRRDLFAPLALPVFGASKESPQPVLPKYLVGVPLAQGGRYLAAAMLVNPEPRPSRYRVRLTLSFIRPGFLLPLFRAYPWTMDVKFPLGGEGGRHDFDIPMGNSTFSWEGSPLIAGTVVAIGGHAHDYATGLRLVDVTSGDTIWQQRPVRDAAGRVLAIPVSRLYRWNRLGVHIQPSHTYRLTVEYDNPLGRPIRFGGMGNVVGLLIPDPGSPWPLADATDPIYRAQLRNLLDNMAGMATAHDEHGRH